MVSPSCPRQPPQSNAYWSSSTSQSDPPGAQGMDFVTGDTVEYGKTNGIYVRAVRAGS